MATKGTKNVKPTKIIGLTNEEKELILRVASLIEQGSDSMKQITGRYFEQDMSGCCALGACLKALGKTYKTTRSIDWSFLELLGAKTWPRMGYPISDLTPFAANPKTDLASLPDVVIFLNDRLHWDFAKIVDYLRDATLDKPTILKVKPSKRGK